MATSTTSRSALLSGAAKDDTLGADGDFIFSIADLLANDPGGAAKVDLTKQFFFGSTAADQTNQAQYLIDHGITNNNDGTYTITGNATDFDYFVQIGNKGTWSTGHVDVTAPEAHAGPALFTENFDGYGDSVQQTYQDGGVDVFAAVDLTAANQWQSTGSDATKSELGANGYGDIETTSGGFWFDTQNSPGQVNISHAFTDTSAAVDGKTATLSFDAAFQDLDYKGTHYETDVNSGFQFQVDGNVVATVMASDLQFDGDANHNNMVHFEFDLADYGVGDHTLSLVGIGASGFTGLAVDSIQINDWVV